MRAVKQGLLWILAVAASTAAMAGTVHHVRFAQPAQILVWEAGALIARGAEIDLTTNDQNTNAELLGAGTLLPVRERQSRSMIIAIASNTAFSLKSDQTDVAVRVIGQGKNAQLQTDTSPGTLFRQSAKTAVRRGHPYSQAIELEISWSGDAPPNLVLASD